MLYRFLRKKGEILGPSVIIQACIRLDRYMVLHMHCAQSCCETKIRLFWKHNFHTCLKCLLTKERFVFVVLPTSYDKE